MEVMNCRSCKKLFNWLNGPKICPACRDELEKKFNQVRDYLRENKSATMEQISEANDVSVNQIKQWVREERLCFAEGSGVGIECEICGTEIMTGRYCAKCKASVQNNLAQGIIKPKVVEQKKPVRDKDRMRFLDNK